MFNAVSKTSFTAAAGALVIAIGAIVATSDRVAFTVLMFSAAIAAAIGIAIFYFAPRDPVVPVSAEVEAATVRSIDVTDVPRQSPWPLLGAVAVTLLGIGAALGKGLIVIGLIFAVVAAFAWLGQVWREHPSWTQAMTDRINDRFIVPIGLPGTILVLAGLSAVSLSRIFLAVSKDAAPVIGIVVAFAILGAFYLLSTRDTLSRSTISALVVVSALLIAGAGLAGALKGEREFHHAGGEHSSENLFGIRADEDGFVPANLQFPAESQVVIEFHNEGDTERAFAIYEEKGGDVLLEAQRVAPGATVEIEWSTPAPGTYFYQDDLNPDDNGNVTVVEDASEGGEVDPGTNPTTTSTTAP
ncbi:MAG TPA: cupredoxin domain-containing protein [Acidimicrobiales bacterium]|nr:cupredoxin domain-containing protein [Acidimicrobiales bacterium]